MIDFVKKIVGILSRAAVAVLSFPIRLYRKFISPIKPRCCRFTPSCSQYALEALREWGVFRGSALAFWRILRCNPCGGCGPDPVPKRTYKTIDPLKNRKK